MTGGLDFGFGLVVILAKAGIHAGGADITGRERQPGAIRLGNARRQGLLQKTEISGTTRDALGGVQPVADATRRAVSRVSIIMPRTPVGERATGF